MQIDWLTVAAQIVNFLILVWVLQRLLYRPVINAMDRREQGIAARLAQAEQREQQADARARTFAERTAAFDQARERRMAELREEIDREHRQLLDQAREEIDEQRERWREELRHEQEELRGTLRRELAQSAMLIAQNALSDLADTALEKQVVDAFVRRLRALPDADRNKLIAAGERLRVKTAFSLGEEARQRLDCALREMTRASLTIDYERDSALLCGLAVVGAGYKLSWSLADYLEETETRLATVLGERREAVGARS